MKKTGTWENIIINYIYVIKIAWSENLSGQWKTFKVDYWLKSTYCKQRGPNSRPSYMWQLSHSVCVLLLLHILLESHTCTFTKHFMCSNEKVGHFRVTFSFYFEALCYKDKFRTISWFKFWSHDLWKIQEELVCLLISSNFFGCQRHLMEDFVCYL